MRTAPQATRTASLTTLVTFPALVCRPEIQATVKAPAIRNFRLAVTLYYTFAMSLWILVTIIGYW